MESVSSHFANIWLAGDYAIAKETCRRYCMRVGLCVTITPTEFIYTGGQEAGVVVGLRNYPRFPSEPDALLKAAEGLAESLRDAMCQWSYMIECGDKTYWHTTRQATGRFSNP